MNSIKVSCGQSKLKERHAGNLCSLRSKLSGISPKKLRNFDPSKFEPMPEVEIDPAEEKVY